MKKYQPHPNGTLFCLWLIFLLGLVNARAQESPSPSSSPLSRTVRISFLPPPLEGTVSLGIYDAKGTLVRVLRREADINEFDIGPDALSTTWDGKNDAGENLPVGKYTARGFVVGDLAVEGVGFFFNDWITSDDSPRIMRIRSLEMRDENLRLGVELAAEGTGHVLYDFNRKTTTVTDHDSIEPRPAGAVPETPLGAIDPLMTVPGRNDTRWVVDHVTKGSATTELKQFASSGEFLRRLESSPDQPQPIAVAASMTHDRIWLLEENAAIQRIRGLTLTSTKTEGTQPPVSDWKVDFEKKIVAHKDFAIVDGRPVASAPTASAGREKLKATLRPNPLSGDAPGQVELAIGFGADGSFLKTADGLPLFTISENSQLVRSLLVAHGPNAIDVFEDDGAVVEQFRVSAVDQMMSFDCGGFELK